MHLLRSAYNSLEFSIDDSFSLETQNLFCITDKQEFYFEIMLVCGGYYD